MPAAGYPFPHMNAPLAHDIVANERRLYSAHVEVQGFEYGIVHVFLAFLALVLPDMPIDMGTHASPF
jgi:hypothetical protein